MPGYWGVNARERTEHSFFVSSRRGISIRKGDELVLTSEHHEGLVFSGTARVEAVRELKEAPSADEVPRRKYEVTFDAIQPLKTTAALDFLRYSLGRVTNFDRPGVHFRRNYVRLSAFDFATIKTGRIFWARTAFGTILNALPQEVQRALQIQLLSDGAIAPGGELNYRLALSVLEQFLDVNYFKVGELLRAIQTELSGLRATQGGSSLPQQIYLSDDGDEGRDSVIDQAATFKRLLQEFYPDGEESLLAEIRSQAERQSTVELEFEKNFRGTRWPLQKKRG